jgi:hypothetical protein
MGLIGIMMIVDLIEFNFGAAILTVRRVAEHFYGCHFN